MNGDLQQQVTKGTKVPYYLSRYVEIRANVCAPLGADQPGWKSIDLRPDGGATVEGGGLNACLLWLPLPNLDPGLVRLAVGRGDTLDAGALVAVNARLGTSYTASTITELLRQLMRSPPPSAWKPARPGRTGHIEIILDGMEIRERA